MKIFRDLDLVEQMGTGIIKILQSNDKSSFEFFPNFIKVSFPFNENKFNEIKNDNLLIDNNLSNTQKQIIKLIIDVPTITQKTLAKILNVNVRTIQRNIKELMDLGIINRSGTNKKGKWELTKNINI